MVVACAQNYHECKEGVDTLMSVRSKRISFQCLFVSDLFISTKIRILKKVIICQRGSYWSTNSIKIKWEDKWSSSYNHIAPMQYSRSTRFKNQIRKTKNKHVSAPTYLQVIIWLHGDACLKKAKTTAQQTKHVIAYRYSPPNWSNIVYMKEIHYPSGVGYKHDFISL